MVFSPSELSARAISRCAGVLPHVQWCCSWNHKLGHLAQQSSAETISFPCVVHDTCIYFSLNSSHRGFVVAARGKRWHAADKDNTYAPKHTLRGQENMHEAFPDNGESVKSQQTQSNTTASMSVSGMHAQVNSVWCKRQHRFNYMLLE